MARARSSDVPRYDTYPAPTPAEAASTPQDWPYEPKTDEYRSGNERLNQAAEQIGTTMGRVVAATRERFGVIRGGQGGLDFQEKIGEMSDQARARVNEIGEQARERLENLRETAGEQLDDLRSQARDAAKRARARVNEAQQQARQYAHENPLHVIAGALLAGILLGIGVRIWRANNG